MTESAFSCRIAMATWVYPGRFLRAVASVIASLMGDEGVI
jgi:hypothetical protein